MFDAYTRIFARCGLKAFPVEADTGVIGGNFSHEFMVPAETGENEVVFCEACGYAANIEKATSGIPKTATHEAGAAIEKFATPGVVTIEALTKVPYSVPANRQIKTLVYIADSKPVIVLIRGDDQLNETKLMARTGAVAARPATPEECVATLGAKPGSLGAVASTLERRPPARLEGETLQHAVPEAGAPQIFADERLRGANDMTTGANEDGFHFRNVSIERDIKVTQWFDLRTVTAGEPCAKCGKSLKIRRAIEVGHVFKLGTKYSEKLGATFLDEAGARKPAVMGCYGIGVTRTMQAVIEQCNDKDGIIWPLSVAPYTVCITPLGVAPDGAVMQLAEKIYAELTARGVDVILDDRDERPGVKFKDADLVGFPIRLAIGEKSLAKGEVEIKPRGGTLQSLKADAAVEAVLKLVPKL
jgi:prolyl-tRNA synthetase